VEDQRVPEVKFEFPQTPDNEWKDLQFRFDGEWLPHIDPLLIGAQNYAELQNMRYRDSGLEGIAGYSKINTTALSTYTKIRNGHQLRTTKTQATYTLVHALNTSGQGRVYQNLTAIESQGDFDTSAKFDTSGNSYFQDASTGLDGRFADAPQSNVAYCNGEESMIYGGNEQRVAALFTTDNDVSDAADRLIAYPVDRTDVVNTELTTDNFTFNQADQAFMILMTTRPIQSVKYYVSSANASVSSQTIKTWTGASWSADLVADDGTKPGTKTLATTGVVTLSAHTDSTSKPFHFEELYLYAYLIELSAGSAGIYNMTVDFAFQSVKDVWDGVYRQPIQFQKYDTATANHYVDYTLQVNESSDVAAPIGADLAGLLTGTEYVYIMFEDPIAAIKFTMLGGKVNLTAAATLAVKYWDGDSFNAVSGLIDGTKLTNGLDQSGLITWTTPSDEVPQTKFGSYGYMYELSWGANISGVKDDQSVIIDIVTGIPSQKTVKPFDFPVQFKNRLMLGAFTQGAEANRLDYSVNNAPDVWNGTDSSDDGNQSLYFGGNEKITCATQLYNRFGSNVFTMLLVMKQAEVYLLLGDTPEDFTIYPVSLSIGCPAPLTLDVAELGFELGEGITRNVAIWLSHSGPMMFDGAVLSPIKGVENYFKPNYDRYLNWASISRARGWVDPIYKEYNLLLPVDGSDCDTWLVYDLIRKKWYEKQTDAAAVPQAAFHCLSSAGKRVIYGGIDTGYMMYLENGDDWDSTAISQKVRTGDFFPSNNMWDETTLRKLKIIAVQAVTASTLDVAVRYFGNTDATSGIEVDFQDSGTGYTGVDVDWENWTDVVWAESSQLEFNLRGGVAGQRLMRLNADLNRTGWCHAFEFTVSTDDIPRGFKPISWGLRYRVERKDETAT
jgi:hypothetical protein